MNKKVTIEILCDSNEMFTQATKEAKELIDLDRVQEDEFVGYPGGVEKRGILFYKFGDYFESAEIVEKSDRLFHIEFTLGGLSLKKGRPFWKDFIVDMLRKFSNLGAKAEVQYSG